jgi:hypothetical protein
MTTPTAQIADLEDSFRQHGAASLDQQMHMRIVGDPVIDGDAVQIDTKVVLHLGCQVACEGFESVNAAATLRRSRQPEICA